MQRQCDFTNHQGPAPLHACETTAPAILLVDPVLPDLLLRPRRVSAGTKNSPHLINTSEDDLPGNKPANTLRARRAGQATLVRPELVEV